MEIEAVNSNYSASESSKVTNAPVETYEAASASVEQASVAAVKTVTSSSQTGEGKENRQGEEKKEKERVASEASIDDAVKNANRKMERTRCEYSYHKETNRVSIKVFDADTDEVIREIPPEKSLDMLQKMWEMAGILVDERR